MVYCKMRLQKTTYRHSITHSHNTNTLPCTDRAGIKTSAAFHLPQCGVPDSHTTIGAAPPNAISATIHRYDAMTVAGKGNGGAVEGVIGVLVKPPCQWLRCDTGGVEGEGCRSGWVAGFVQRVFQRPEGICSVLFP